MATATSRVREPRIGEWACRRMGEWAKGRMGEWRMGPVGG
jgi:hypothetical protein